MNDSLQESPIERSTQNRLAVLWRRDLLAFVKFAIVGLIATGMHMFVVVVLVESGSFSATVASAPAYLIANLVGFFLNKHWVYRSQARGTREYFLYLFISTIGFFANLAIMYVLTDIFSVWYPLAVLVVSVVLMVWSFMMNRIYTFSGGIQSDG